MSIKCYIPSKNRAFQCDALLNSLERNAPGLFRPYVVYRTSNDKYLQGYKLLINRWADKVYFTREEDDQHSQRAFYHFLELDLYSNNIIGLFADDCLFYSKTNIYKEEIEHQFYDQRLWSFSFRIGQNVSQHNYISSTPNKKPIDYYEEGKFLYWNFREGFNSIWESSFSFPFGFDGCLYRAKDLLFLANGENFGSIATWEHFICRNNRLDLLPNRKYMISPLYSTVFCQQINNANGNGLTNKGYRRTLEELNQVYLDGYIIDFDSMDFSNINSTHQEIPFNVKKL